MYLNDEYYEGKRAYQEGYGWDECPYPHGTTEAEDWVDGFEDAEGESSM
jgi:ribosome modulation factor